MEALRASYASDSSDSDSESNPTTPPQPLAPLPPPPISLLHPPNSPVPLPNIQVDRVRSFPHVDGNYALHVYTPVHIQSLARKEMAPFLNKVTALVPGLHAIDVDVPLSSLVKDETLFEQVVLGREFHISLGRTVPIRVHQIQSVLSMLRQRLQYERRYWIDFNRWEIFVNDDSARTFLSLEVVAGGLPQIRKQIQAVNEVYKLHNLPEFYKDPRPHISVAWALGDIRGALTRAVEEEMKKYTVVSASLRKCIFTSKFSGIVCKVGSKTHEICKFQEE